MNPLISVQSRRLLFRITLSILSIFILLIALNLIRITPRTGLIARDYISFIATTIATTGGISIAVIFLTAQLRPLGPQASVVVSLYRSHEFLALTTSFVICIVGLLLLWPFTTSHSHPYLYKAIDFFIAFGVGSIVLLLPAIMLQIENFSSTNIALKLAERITPDSIKQYGLSSISEVDGVPGRYNIQLRYQAIDYYRYDPLRPLHEVIQNAIIKRDRLEIGKLHEILLSPIPAIYGKKNTPAEEASRLSVLLHIMHYCVRQAKNLQKDWEGYDVGRHSLVHNLSLLIRRLIHCNAHPQAIDLVLVAVWEISYAYRDIQPFGRVEPINVLFQVANELSVSRRQASAEMAGRILGCISICTKQVSESRTPNTLIESLPNHVRTQYENARKATGEDLSWTPIDPANNPWRLTR